jgi:ABC-type phosphate/phosphonate transport system ATPase subunit
MPKRSSRDLNQNAFRVVQQSTGQADIAAEATNDSTPAQSAKNPAAVALGRLGGLKGGKARAKALSSAQRKRIAAKAALARWGKR